MGIRKDNTNDYIDTAIIDATATAKGDNPPQLLMLVEARDKSIGNRSQISEGASVYLVMWQINCYSIYKVLLES